MKKTKHLNILEELKMQPLSEEEKVARHIIGRLYGPIATCKESTRNGRRYNRELWETALNDDIFKEKIANKSLFLELGHPSDREETDMEKVCACIPEMPKIVDDDLYAVIDILDTNNGKLLKTLCDYGFVPGISSRGSGDIMDNDEVDPETFFLETWDIVQLPAVKKARLQVLESFDKEELQLKQVLVESYKKAEGKDKLIMKEALDNLEIKIEDKTEKTPEESEKITEAAPEVATYPAGTPKDASLVPNSEKDDSALLEDVEEEEEEEAESTEEAAEEKTDPIEEPAEAEASAEAEVEEDEADNDAPLSKVSDLIATLKAYKDRDLEMLPIEIDGTEYETSILMNDEEEGKLIIGIDCIPMEDSEDTEAEGEEPKAEENAEANSAEEVAEIEEEGKSEEAGDAGDEELLDSLKEAVRQKDALEKEVKSLKDKQAVGDAEVKDLKENLEKYKTAFARTSELAAKATKAENDVKSLTEQLAQKDTAIVKIKEDAAKAIKLTESAHSNDTKVKTLTEKLAVMQKESEANEKALREELGQAKQKINERTALAKKYKSQVSAMLEKYVASKASMLGVRSIEITSRLNENYSMDDIDSVCDDLLDGAVNIGHLPFGNIKPAKTTIKESVKPVSAPTDPYNGYEVDDSLFELAGIDKDKI